MKLPQKISENFYEVNNSEETANSYGISNLKTNVMNPSSDYKDGPQRFRNKEEEFFDKKTNFYPSRRKDKSLKPISAYHNKDKELQMNKIRQAENNIRTKKIDDNSFNKGENSKSNLHEEYSRYVSLKPLPITPLNNLNKINTNSNGNLISSINSKNSEIGNCIPLHTDDNTIEESNKNTETAEPNIKIVNDEDEFVNCNVYLKHKQNNQYILSANPITKIRNKSALRAIEERKSSIEKINTNLTPVITKDIYLNYLPKMNSKDSVYPNGVSNDIYKNNKFNLNKIGGTRRANKVLNHMNTNKNHLQGDNSFGFNSNPVVPSHQAVKTISEAPNMPKFNSLNTLINQNFQNQPYQNIAKLGHLNTNTRQPVLNDHCMNQDQAYNNNIIAESRRNKQKLKSLNDNIYGTSTTNENEVTEAKPNLTKHIEKTLKEGGGRRNMEEALNHKQPNYNFNKNFDDIQNQLISNITSKISYGQYK